jgi:putative PIN family toxin of toxin-antitoxin system
MLRVVVDTNLWISFLIGRKLAILTDLFKRSDIQILSSSEQPAELSDVSTRFNFRKYFTEVQADELVNLLYASAEFVDIRERVRACRDENDDFLLDIAVNGRADIFITGDNDLLVLNPFRVIDIVIYIDFENRYSG